MGGDFHAEIDSINAAASWMTSNAVATAQKLVQTMTYLDNFAEPGDWSDVPSCRAFGASYNSAIAVYKKAADDMLADATTMRDALLAIASEYKTVDDNNRAAFEARMAALGTGAYMTHSPADAAYTQHRGDLHSDDPEQAKPQDADTGSGGTGSTPGTDGTVPNTTTGGRAQIR